MTRQNAVNGWTVEDYRNTVAGALDQMREHGAEHANLGSARAALDRLQEAGETAGLAGVAGELDGYERQLLDGDRSGQTDHHGADVDARATAGAGWAAEPADGLTSDGAVAATRSGATRQYCALVKTELGRDDVVYVRANSENAAIDAAYQHPDVAVVIDAFEGREDLDEVKDRSGAELAAAASVACAGAAAALHEVPGRPDESLESGETVEKLGTDTGSDACSASVDEDGGF